VCARYARWRWTFGGWSLLIGCDVIVLDGEVEIGIGRFVVVDVILGKVFDVIARLCEGRVLLAIQSELLAVISVVEESAISMRRHQQAKQAS
jgi:hypothetical protein